MRFIFIIVPKSLFIQNCDVLEYETYAEDEYWAIMNFYMEYPDWKII